jgi:hypothetical protein
MTLMTPPELSEDWVPFSLHSDNKLFSVNHFVSEGGLLQYPIYGFSACRILQVFVSVTNCVATVNLIIEKP